MQLAELHTKVSVADLLAGWPEDLGIMMSAADTYERDPNATIGQRTLVS